MRRPFIWEFPSKAFMKEHLYSCSFVSIVTALVLSHCLENKRPLTQYKSFTKNSTAKPTMESGVLVDLRMAMGHYSYLHLNSPPSLPWTSLKVLIRPVLSPLSPTPSLLSTVSLIKTSVSIEITFKISLVFVIVSDRFQLTTCHIYIFPLI